MYLQTRRSFNRGDTSDGDDQNTPLNQEYQETTYSYTDTNGDGSDALSLVDTVTRTDGTKEVYKYDEMGRLKRIDYRKADGTIGQYVEYQYNKLGQVLTETSVTIDEDGVETPHQTSYIYDWMGRTIGVWEGTYSSYDDNGVPVKVTYSFYDDNGVLINFTNGLDIEYTYNKVGQVTCINYNTSTSTEHNLYYDYDGYGRIRQIRLDSTPTDDNVVRQYFYDATTGQLDYIQDYRDFATVTSELGAYIKTDYTYNSIGKVSQMTCTDSAKGQTEQYTIEYDGRGSIISEQTDMDYNAPEAATSVFKAFDYDSLGRLVFAGNGDDKATTQMGWDTHTTYTYDLDGNRKTMDNTTNATVTSYVYDYNQFNQLKTVTKNDVEYEAYTYDLRGNQLTDTIEDYLSVTVDGTTTPHDKTTTYEYDLRNQLESAGVITPVGNESTGTVTDETVNSSYTYNVGGQRMNKYEEGDDNYVGDDTTKYFYTGSAILYTTNKYNELMTENIIDPSGQIIASKRFDDDGNMATTYELANLYFFYHYDIRGSVSAIVRPDGTLMESYTYDEYGNQAWTEYNSNGSPVDAVNEIFDNEVTYTGSIKDASTGLQYMNARYYNSTTGTFLTQDTYTGNAYEPWTQHLYSYCGNNPTSFIDPTGHMRDETCAGFNGQKYDAKKVNAMIAARKMAQAKRAEIETRISESNNGSDAGASVSGNSGGTEMSKKEVIEEFRKLTNVQAVVTDCVWKSLEVDIGIGEGYGAGVSVGGLTAQAVARGDVLNLSIDNGIVDFGAKKETTAGIYGPYFPIVKTNDVPEYCSYLHDKFGEFHAIESTESDGWVLGVGAQAYFMFGATCSVGLNVNDVYNYIVDYANRIDELSNIIQGF